jgi:predicted dehydrogenase
MADGDKVFNVAVIGYGMSATIFHIPFITLTKQFKLHSVVQRKPNDKYNAQKDLPNIKHHISIEPVLGDPDVDIIAILTPPNTHYELARKALEAGKHVLVEKPFVPTSTEALELVAVAKKAGRLICVYQNRRWDADFLTIKRLIKAGTLGRIYEFETHFDRFRLEKPETWKGHLTMNQGGGAIYDLGSHLIDQVYVLFGMPTTVYGKFINQRSGTIDFKDPDSITAILSYADTGLLAQIRIGVMSVEAQQLRFWVRGTKGSYHKAGLDPQEDQLKAGSKGIEPGFGRENETWTGYISHLEGDGTIVDEKWPTVDPDTYLEFYTLFAKAVASGREEDIPVKATEAADVLRIIEAIRKSAETGSEVAP